jgi:hypothetical protein
MTPQPVTFPRHRFPAESISYAVWLYHVFNLNLRDVELIIVERRVIVSHETIRLWCGTWMRRSSASEEFCIICGARSTSVALFWTLSCRRGEMARRPSVVSSGFYKG